MTAVVLFVSGLAVGVIYEKSLRAWKEKLSRAAHAAQKAMND